MSYAKELAALEEFLHQERQRYSDDGNNKFAFTFSDVLRYLRFTNIAAERHAEALLLFSAARKPFQEYVDQKAAGGVATPIPPAAAASLHRSMEYTTLIHYETETFYLFAKILLDSIAKFVRHYFYEQRGVKMSSHDQFVRVAEAYGSANGLIYPNGMLELMRKLKVEIADYRDRYIAHAEGSGKLRATIWGPETGPRILHHKLHPRESDRQVESGDIEKMAADLHAYVAHIVAIIVQNRDKSRYAQATAQQSNKKQ